MDDLKGLSWVDPSFVIERTENFKALGELLKKVRFLLALECLLDSDGKNGGSNLWDDEFPGFEICSIQKEKKKNVGSVC